MLPQTAMSPDCNLAGHKVQDAGVADDQVSRHAAQSLIDPPLQNISHESQALPVRLVDFDYTDAVGRPSPGWG